MPPGTPAIFRLLSSHSSRWRWIRLGPRKLFIQPNVHVPLANLFVFNAKLFHRIQNYWSEMVQFGMAHRREEMMCWVVPK